VTPEKTEGGAFIRISGQPPQRQAAQVEVRSARHTLFARRQAEGRSAGSSGQRINESLGHDLGPPGGSIWLGGSSKTD